MDNQEKNILRQLIIKKIKAGKDLQETTASLKRLGYNATTIRRYFRALSY